MKPSTSIRSRKIRTEKLLGILSDGAWHGTKELARRVGHTFGQAKFRLIRSGFVIDRERHPTKKWQRRYRLRRRDSKVPIVRLPTVTKEERTKRANNEKRLNKNKL